MGHALCTHIFDVTGFRLLICVRIQIGNQSLTLSDPTSAPNLPKLRLSYSAGLTILSLFVSCIVAVLAFSFLGLRWTPIRTRFRTALGRDESPPTISKVEMGELSKDDGANSIYSKTAASLYSRDVTEDDSSSMDGEEFGLHPAKVSTGGMVKIIVAGTICGAGIAAMHYVGQFSISGLAKVDNDWWTVVLSILIAVLAVITGLWILFVLLRPKLQHSWYKRLGVAMILGGATTLMHFVALLGTHYYIVAGSFESLLSHRPTSRTLIRKLLAHSCHCFAHGLTICHSRSRWHPYPAVLHLAASIRSVCATANCPKERSPTTYDSVCRAFRQCGQHFGSARRSSASFSSDLDWRRIRQVLFCRRARGVWLTKTAFHDSC